MFQAINRPNSKILYANGPVSGRKHDWYLYYCSEIESSLQQNQIVECVQYLLCGYSGYSQRAFTEVSFLSSNFNNNEKAFDASMAKIRVSVEWIFKKLKIYFPVVDTKQEMKLWKSPVSCI